jgi:hypothetical protein
MAEISVNFMHPTDHGVITVTIDDSMPAEEIISNLLANNFMQPHPDGYKLALLDTGKDMIRPEQTLAEVGARNGSNIQVVPSFPAGAR